MLEDVLGVAGGRLLVDEFPSLFFLVSQVIALAFFRDTPDYKTLAGGLLIVLGGAVIML
jgi:hypothetical protein